MSYCGFLVLVFSGVVGMASQSSSGIGAVWSELVGKSVGWGIGEGLGMFRGVRTVGAGGIGFGQIWLQNFE